MAVLDLSIVSGFALTFHISGRQNCRQCGKFDVKWCEQIWCYSVVFALPLDKSATGYGFSVFPLQRNWYFCCYWNHGNFCVYSNTRFVSKLVKWWVVFVIRILTAWFGKATSIYRLKTALRTDNRVRLMNEIICGIQVIKMYAWEYAFSNMIYNARRYWVLLDLLFFINVAIKKYVIFCDLNKLWVVAMIQQNCW